MSGERSGNDTRKDSFAVAWANALPLALLRQMLAANRQQQEAAAKAANRRQK